MGILQYDPKGMTQVVFFDLINVNAVVADLAILNIVEPVDQVCDRCFSGTGTSNESDLLSWSGKKVYVCRTILSGLYPKSTSSNTTSPFNSM